MSLSSSTMCEAFDWTFQLSVCSWLGFPISCRLGSMFWCKMWKSVIMCSSQWALHMHNTMQGVRLFLLQWKLSTIILMNAGYSCRVGVGQVPQLPEANGNLTRFWWWQYFIVSQSPSSLSGGIVWLGVVSCPTRWSLYCYLGFCDDHPDNRETGNSNVQWCI